MPSQLLLPGFGPPLPLAPSGPQGLFLALFPPATEWSRLAERIDRICHAHRLQGARLRDDRLHVTLHVLAELPGPVPMDWIDAAAAVGRAVRHPPIDILFDRAMSFVHSGLGGKAFVLSADEPCGNAPVQRLGAELACMLRRYGLRPAPSRRPHMTMLYDRRIVAEHAIAPVCWTATEFVLVLSHVGRTHHEWLGRWPLDAER